MEHASNPTGRLVYRSPPQEITKPSQPSTEISTMDQGLLRNGQRCRDGKFRHLTGSSRQPFGALTEVAPHGHPARVQERVSLSVAVETLRPEDAAEVVGHLEQTLTAMLSFAAFVHNDQRVHLFDAKNDFIRVLRDLWQSVPARYHRAPRRERQSIVSAAHAALTASALFDTIALDLHVGALNPKRSLIEAMSDERFADLSVEVARDFLQRPIDLPDPRTELRSFDQQLARLYGMRLGRLRRHLTDLRILEPLKISEALRHDPLRILDAFGSDDKARRVTEEFAEKAPARARDRYHRYRARLAVDVVEVGFRTGLWGHLASSQRAERCVEPGVIDRLRGPVAAFQERSGLSALRIALGVVDEEPSDDRWATLRKVYREEFDRPLIDEHEQAMPSGWSSPLLSAAYVNPSFRAVEFAADMRPSEQRWWTDNVEARDDLVQYLAGVLTDPKWHKVPVLVLGDPGAGKSVFTSSLAAVLSELGYCVARVDLRSITATLPIDRQIEEALHVTLGRPVQWADLADAAGNNTVVVLFDGFDELLQTSEVNQSSYLEDVWRFQQQSARRGTPLLTIVTSRTLVAHRARIPRGAAVLRLEPFERAQITDWLETWNRAAESHNAEHGLTPLTAEVVLRYPDLARQPLLLLMLAVYDLRDNELQRQHGALGNGELYELLLSEFTRRQVRKKHMRASDDQIRRAVDAELDGLSIAALAMLNRGQLWINQEQLDEDLRALTKPSTQPVGNDTFEERLTAAELLVDRFFFIHDTQKRVGASGEQTVHRYEFMHSTFGEYLVARLVVRALRDLLHRAAQSSHVLSSSIGYDGAPDDVNDMFLANLLSYELLSAREAILQFSGLLTAALGDDDRQRLLQVLGRLLNQRVVRHEAPTLVKYAPRTTDNLSRIATYTANLALLIVLINADRLPLDELFSGAEPLARWNRLARVWHAGLDPSAWNALIRTISISSIGGGRWVLGRFANGDDRFPQADISEAYLTARFMPHLGLDRLLGAVEPVARDRDGWLGDTGSPIAALLSIVLADRSMALPSQPDGEASGTPLALFAAAFDVAQELDEVHRDAYLMYVVVHSLGQSEAVLSAQERVVLLRRAVDSAGRGGTASELLATIIRQCRMLTVPPPLQAEVDDIVRTAATLLLDLSQIHDAHALLETLLTLAEFEIAGEPVAVASPFANHLGEVPTSILTQPLVWPRVVRAVCASRARMWLHYYGKTFLPSLDSELVVLITPEQMEVLVSMGFDEDAAWLAEFRSRWSAALGGQEPLPASGTAAALGIRRGCR